ncbi:MAG: DUF2085 domain-containing protein [Thermoplasmata archaeon]|nr:DUF2085 domain-containing protein [Thermoplasmata archaeon]
MTKEDIGSRIIDDRSQLLKRMCHGKPERCLWIKGSPFPLCTRCMGFYLALIIGLDLGPVALLLIIPASRIVLIIFSISIIPLAVDGWTQYLGWRRSNNKLRMITGLLAGLGSGFTFVYCVLWVYLRFVQ